MIDVQPFAKLGAFRNHWLNARHHFSFGAHSDPKRMGLGSLRVWNDDEVAPGQGFDPHPHRDMEIITYVRAGAITHRDSLGNEGRTEAGDVQVMHAGTGITHAEYNAESVPTRLFQIWVIPDRRGMAPGWAAAKFPAGSEGSLVALADGRAEADGTALPLHADAAVLAGTVRAGETVHHRLGPGRAAYLVLATGSVSINGVAVATRDGATITDESDIAITAIEDAQVVLVDVVGST